MCAAVLEYVSCCRVNMAKSHPPPSHGIDELLNYSPSAISEQSYLIFNQTICCIAAYRCIEKTSFLFQKEKNQGTDIRSALEVEAPPSRFGSTESMAKTQSHPTPNPQPLRRRAGDTRRTTPPPPRGKAISPGASRPFVSNSRFPTVAPAEPPPAGH